VYDDDDDDGGNKKKKKGNTEFECPECNAHNPVHDGYDEGSEVQCFYCGVEFRVLAGSGGKFKFKAI